MALTLAYPFLLFLSLSAPCIASSLVQIVGASSLASNRRFIFLILLFLSSLFFFICQIFREEIIRVNRSMGYDFIVKTCRKGSVQEWLEFYYSIRFEKKCYVKRALCVSVRSIREINVLARHVAIKRIKDLVTLSFYSAQRSRGVDRVDNESGQVGENTARCIFFSPLVPHLRSWSSSFFHPG